MTTINIPQYCRQPLVSNRWIRNSFYPDARVVTFLQEEANRVARWRSKSWSFTTPLNALPGAGGTGERSRWRWAFHSSKFARYIWIRFIMAGGRNATDPYGGLSIYNPATPATVGIADFHFGNSTITNPDTPAFFGIGTVPTNDGTQLVAIPADTALEGRIYDYDNGRIIAACVYEECMESDTANGYLQSGVVAGGPIYDEDRGDLVTLARDVWKRNGAPLFTWSSNTDALAVTRTSATAANWIDQTITAESSTSPGVTIDLSNRSTVRRASVPCIWKVFAKNSSGTGTVKLIGLTTGTVATLSPNTTSGAWYSATVTDIDTIEDKWEIHLAGNGVGTTTLYAASLFEYEA